MAHPINNIINKIEGRGAVNCNDSCKYWKFSHLDSACVRNFGVIGKMIALETMKMIGVPGGNVFLLGPNIWLRISNKARRFGL